MTTERDEPEAPVNNSGDPWPWPPYTWAEFRTRGFLWLLNTAVLHPRGYALQVHWPDGTTDEAKMDGSAEPSGWSVVGDGGEVWTFAAPPDRPGYIDTLFDGVERTLEVARHRAVISALLDRGTTEADEIAGLGVDVLPCRHCGHVVVPGSDRFERDPDNPARWVHTDCIPDGEGPNVDADPVVETSGG